MTTRDFAILVPLFVGYGIAQSPLLAGSPNFATVQAALPPICMGMLEPLYDKPFNESSAAEPHANSLVDKIVFGLINAVHWVVVFIAFGGFLFVLLNEPDLPLGAFIGSMVGGVIATWLGITTGLFVFLPDADCTSLAWRTVTLIGVLAKWTFLVGVVAGAGGHAAGYLPGEDDLVSAVLILPPMLQVGISTICLVMPAIWLVSIKRGRSTGALLNTLREQFGLYLVACGLAAMWVLGASFLFVMLWPWCEARGICGTAVLCAATTLVVWPGLMAKDDSLEYVTKRKEDEKAQEVGRGEPEPAALAIALRAYGVAVILSEVVALMLLHDMRW